MAHVVNQDIALPAWKYAQLVQSVKKMIKHG